MSAQASLIIDCEYMRHYMAAHKRTDGWHVLERRAECHASAMEHITPCIFPDEQLVGRKTRFIRGAIPLCHYASGYILRELNKQAQEAQDAVTEVGTGGGFAESRKLAETGNYIQFGKSFLIPKEDAPFLHDCAEYFVGKSMQDVGDRLWKPSFEGADYIEKGWKSVLYTAPHDPCPEGRIVLDFESGLGKGLLGLRAEIEGHIKATNVSDVQSAEKVYFWRAAIRSIDGTLAWCHSYAVKAREIAASTTDPEVAARMRRIADMVEWAPAHQPRTFREAMQAWWLLYLAGHLEGAHLGYSPGRFDRYMYPYFKASMDKGEITSAEALVLLEEMRVKMTEISYVASFSWEGVGSGNLFQNLIMGGTDEAGRRGDNELSMLLVQAAINCRTIQPTLSIWYDGTLSDAFLMKAAECVKTGLGFPAFFNLKVYLQHEMERSHLPLATIRKYAAMGGCTEPTLEGMSYGIVQAGFVNHCKVFELAMYGGVDPRTGLKFRETPLPTSFEELRDLYLLHLADAIHNWQRYWNYCMAAHRHTCSLIFSSVLVRDCIGRGKCMDDGGAINNGTPTTLSSGMVNVANSLAAVKELVPSRYTMEEVRAACRANWAGQADMRHLMQEAPKWGNNDDRVDQLFVSLFGSYCDIVKAQLNFLGEPYDPSMLAISTHAPFGRACLATPDGRVEGEQLCDGVTSPFPGTDTHGPLAVLLSAAKVDHTLIRGGLHNMKFHPTALEGISGSRKLLSLVRTYFQSNGFQIQFNVVDSEMLRDAQAHPENYRDLIVRVAGFSAFFVELSKPIQDEVIRRTEHSFTAPPSGGHADDAVPAQPTSPSEAVIKALGAPEPQTRGCVFDIEEYAVRDGPGIRTTVFLKGCPLRCRWCCNPEGQLFVPELLHSQPKCRKCGSCYRACPHGAVTFTPENGPTFDRTKCLKCAERTCIRACHHGALRQAGQQMTVAEVSERLDATFQFADMSGGGVTLSGGDPLATPHLPFVRSFVAQCAAKGIPVAVETSGSWTFGPGCVDEALARAIGLYYFDVKVTDPERHRAATGNDNKTIMENLRTLARLVPEAVVISVPVIPTINDTVEEITAIAQLARSLGLGRMRLLGYHTLGRDKYADLGRQMDMPRGRPHGRAAPPAARGGQGPRDRPRRVGALAATHASTRPGCCSLGPPVLSALR
ncbi:4-hydroxyphenylacetate decarboxylase-activating enzyme fusion protein [Paratrimastix pyriformis]|uniref:4-hydroxyphenylacetate decarboxylase-activating enzyme fusion protein n=1 Tax=Paratrimastix pyriformis TaxID=342808 RepID=A0ABQ8UUK9_9EUKA|nr:4-hydroxyphenylacetate decarboxylase-activating enzyme fusion protein [Paratrimastix pyriformis]